jgi:hypothetical protein
MIIHFTEESSDDMPGKLGIVVDMKKEINTFFESKSYGAVLEVVYIAVFCMSPKFETLFHPRKPKYVLKGKEYIFDEIPTKSDDKSLIYELRLDYSKYQGAFDIKPIFAHDTLDSLDIITKVKQIKDFNFSKFKTDLEGFFKLIGWI